MARIRGDRVDLSFPSIEGEGIKSSVGHPKSLLEPLSQLHCETLLDASLRRESKERINRRHFSPRIIGIPLHFDERDGSFGEASVGKRDRIVGVLPTLIDQTAPCPAFIFHKAVAIHIAIAVYPSQCGFGIRQESS